VLEGPKIEQNIKKLISKVCVNKWNGRCC
jgi:hypothetical protein